MAEHTVDQGSGTAQAISDEPLTKRQAWNHEATQFWERTLPMPRVMDFANLTHDVAMGISAVADVLLQDDLRRCEPESYQPLLTVCQREALTRLAAVTADVLVSKASTLMEDAYTDHTPEGRAEQRRSAMRDVCKG